MATAKKATASKSAALTTGGKVLTVKAAPNARFKKIVVELERAFKLAGCPGCRSGKDRIVFEDIVTGQIK